MYVSPSLPPVQHRVDRSPLIDRMPHVIGEFISKHVYRSKLKTHHDDHTETCCRFVDVSNGKEFKKGNSWKVRTILPSTGLLFVLKFCFYLLERRRSQSRSPYRKAL